MKTSTCLVGWHCEARSPTLESRAAGIRSGTKIRLWGAVCRCNMQYYLCLSFHQTRACVWESPSPR